MPIKPALTPSQWARRRCGAVSVEMADGATHVALRGPDGNAVTVSNDDEIVALIALANDALSDDDERKLCRTDLAVLSVVVDEYRIVRGHDRQILTYALLLHEKLSALLRAVPPATPPLGVGVQTQQD